MKYAIWTLAIELVLLSSLPVDAADLTAQERERLSEFDARPIQKFNNVDLSEYLQLRTNSLASIVQKPSPRDFCGVLARRSLDQPYRLGAVQFDLGESDCVSFVNRTLALSLASDWKTYALLVERIRHKDGGVDYRNRNFLTLGDWLPNNAWLLDDVTAALASHTGRPAQPLTHVVPPKTFVERPAAPGSKFSRVIFEKPDLKSGVGEIRKDVCIPADNVADVFPWLQTGDVILILRKRQGEHLDCDHLGMVLVDQAVVKIVHSAPPGVQQEDLAVFPKRCHWITGFKFLRLKDNATEIAIREVERIESKVTIPSPDEQDKKNAAYRQRRAKK